MALRAKLLTELVGSFVFMTVIAFSPHLGALAPLAIGLALTAMVYMGGHVSGAHYNPAVSFGLLLRRVIDFRTVLAYWITQLVAAVLAFSFAYAIASPPLPATGVHPGVGVSWPAAISAETVFTAALVTVVLNVAATRATAGNSFYGLAIGFTVAAGAFAVGPISGGAFNPAVGVGANIAAAFHGHVSLADSWLYIVGPFVGAAIAAGIHSLQERAAPVAPEESESERT